MCMLVPTPTYSGYLHTKNLKVRLSYLPIIQKSRNVVTKSITKEDLDCGRGRCASTGMWGKILKLHQLNCCGKAAFHSFLFIQIRDPFSTCKVTYEFKIFTFTISTRKVWQ